MAAKVANPARQYANMEFPDYVFREWPKWIILPDGTQALAEHQRHELQLLEAFHNPLPSQEQKERLEIVSAMESLRKEKEDLERQLAELRDKASGEAKTVEDLPLSRGQDSFVAEGIVVPPKVTLAAKELLGPELPKPNLQLKTDLGVLGKKN